MSAAAVRAPVPAMRRALVWLLALAILVYGHSAVLVPLLGPAHRHEAASAVAQTSPLGLIEGWVHDLRTWRADLHARLLPPGFPLPADLQSYLPAHPQAEVATRTTDHAALHGSYQRHHHDPHDPSVVTLDAVNGEAGPDSASQSTAGSASLPLALAPRWALLSPSGRTLAWPPDRSDRWTDAALRLSERPPRG